MKFIKNLTIILSLCVLISACKTTDRVKVEDFKVNMDSPQFTIGEVDLQLDTLMGMGPLKKQTVTVLYFPREDAICLRYKYEFYTYNQFWDKRSRLIFINALQKYNEDYEARNLQRNYIKSQQKYGTVRGYLVWQLMVYTIQLYANMNVDLGYTFKDRSPYFTIYQREAEYTDSSDNRSNDRTSPALSLYFTRAQAAELSEIFDQYILSDINLPDDYEEADISGKKDNIPKDDY
ncbi:hypothetical protein [Treponema sp. R6D11]